MAAAGCSCTSGADKHHAQPWPAVRPYGVRAAGRPPFSGLRGVAVCVRAAAGGFAQVWLYERRGRRQRRW
jgi:hypothetical protein